MSEAATPEPTQSLPPEARGLFVLGALARAVPVAIGIVIGGGALTGSDAPGVVAWLAWGLAVGVVLVGGLVLPMVRWRTWRYEVRDQEIDLRRGAVVVTRTLIPMTRVQHVDTRRTPLSDLFDLRAVTVHTAADSHEIPALRPGDAVSIRDRIAALARQPDEL